MWPGPSAVCHQCSCSPHGRCLPIRPCDATSEGATLVTSTATSSIQVVCTRASLSERHSAEIHDWSDSVCRQHCQSSFVLCVICRPCHAIHTSLNYRRPSIHSFHCHWSASVEHNLCSAFALNVIQFLRKTFEIILVWTIFFFVTTTTTCKTMLALL